MVSLKWNQIVKMLLHENKGFILEHYRNFVDNPVAKFDRTDTKFASSTVSKRLSNWIMCYREIFHERNI